MSCKVEPKVKNSRGEFIIAPLYNDLKKMVGPISASNVFEKLISEEFKSIEGYDKIEFDEYKMPKIESLLEHTDFSEYIDHVYYSNYLSKQILGASSVKIPNTTKFKEFCTKIMEFNNRNKYFNCFLIKNGNGSYSLTVAKNTVKSFLCNNQFENFVKNTFNVIEAFENAKLDDNYINNFILSEYNVSYMKDLDSGVFDPNKIINKANDLINKENLNTYMVSSLAKNSLFELPYNRYYNYVMMMESSEEYNDFKYNYLKEHELINETVTKEDVVKNKKYSEIVINHILLNALTGAFSLSDAKNNQYLLDRVNILVGNISSALNNIDKNKLIPSDEYRKEYTESNQNKISLKNLFRNINKVDSNSNEKLQSAKELIEKLIKSENTRLVTSVRSGNKKEANLIKERIIRLTEMYENGTMNLAFVKFLQEQTEEISNLYENMQKLLKTDDLAKKTASVRNLIQLCNYYSNCIEYFNAYMSKNSDYEQELKEDVQVIIDKYKDSIEEASFESLVAFKNRLDNADNSNRSKQGIDNIKAYSILIQNYIDVTTNSILNNNQLSVFTQTINSIREEAQKNALDLTAVFLEKASTKESRTIPWGKQKGQKLDIREELKRMNNDINMYDLYLDAMADCPDDIIRLTDKAIKTTKNNSRLKVLELAREIKMEAGILKKSGINDFSWMYKRDENGKKTGKYIIESDDEFSDILNNSAKLRFYNFFIKTKKQIDSYYPNNNGTAQIIGIRKDRLERLKNSKNIKDFGNQIWEGIKDNWIDREDDEDIAGYEEMFTDIGGNEIKLLPVYYNSVHEGNADHMSEDAVTTLIAYANKGIEYHEMTSLINSIELEREVLKQREMPVLSGGKKILNAAMKKIYRENPDLTNQYEVTQKDLGRSNAYKMFDEHIDMALYGRFRKKEKNLGPLSTAKIIDQLNKKTAISALSLNLLNGISNVLTGTSITRIEAICQQYFSVKDLVWADLTYNKEMPSYLAEKGNNIKESKLHLFIEQFDVMQDFDTNINESDWMKDTWFKKMINSEFMSVIQNAGEHYMNTRIALALAHSMKLKTKYGKETTLWEMLDIEYLQEDGTYGKDDKKLGARLKLKEECYNKDGSEFKLDNSNIQKITRKMAGINQGIHGIYNKQDANLIQTYSVGRLLYMFRKWIPKSIDKRFANLKYNYDVEDWTEGYYQTAFRFLYGLIKEHNGMKLEIGIRWNQLDERQKANCKRALAETVQFFGLLSLNSVVFSWADDDKSGYSWLQNMAYYQSIRLQSELAALEPLSLLGSRDNMATEFTRMFKNPIAAMSPVSDALKLQQLFFPSTWTDEVQRGPYKGHSKAFVVFWGNKFLFPIGAMIPKNVGPENYVGYYLNN